ncbi:MAG: glycosyltransferase, partial [Deltaproteobacteria bacterium]|nr:glycosyltransferase [Deltaproteobacteria bacterium]
AVAKGAWIALLDSDDTWLPTKLERQVRALAASPGHRLCHTGERWIRRGRRVNPMKKHEKAGGDIFLRCLPRCVISPSSALLSRELFDEVGFFDTSLPACEDYDLWLRICAREPVLFVDEPLVVKYGGHDDQLSRRYYGIDRFRVAALEKLLTGSDATYLSAAQREAARVTLVEKLDIFIAGAEKRGEEATARAYAMRRERWRSSRVRARAGSRA